MIPIVIDYGSGYTKLGYAGNSKPQIVFPTVISTYQGGLSDAGVRGNVKNPNIIEDLNFYSGYEAYSKQNLSSHKLTYPIKHGVFDNWDNMEKIMEHSLFKYLKCSPEDHLFLITEAPLNTPENREYLAEIMFESFNAKGMCIAIQAILALIASLVSSKQVDSLTGTVVDSGDGLTHVIPISNGYVISNAIRNLPIAGKDVTFFIQQLIRERETLSNTGVDRLSYEVVREIKQRYCHVSSNIVKEFIKYDENKDEFIKRFKSHNNGRSIDIEIGYERFLGPEIFFSPKMYNQEIQTSLPELIDESIQNSPVDVRKNLYNNIVLSGGSTMFRDFNKRLQRDIKRIVRGRKTYGVSHTNPPDVSVISHSKQKFAVWSGGNLLASTDEFTSLCKTKQEYEEYGSSIFRSNLSISSLSTT